VRAVIFDLDGTLVQTRIASWEIFERISKRFELGIDRPEQYTPPLVPGVTDVVRRLAGECTLAVMSSNAMQVLRRVLVANDLAFCFAHVFGGDVAPDKRAAIGAFLADSGSGFGRRCAADYDEGGRRLDPGPSSTVLVTDTAGDVRDALAAGIRVVGVAWGMHSVEELTAAGAEFVALWPQEIAAHLLGDAASRPAEGACAVPAGPPAVATRSAAAAPAVAGGDGTAAAQVRAAAAVRRARRTGASSAASDSPAGHSPAAAPSAASRPDSARPGRMSAPAASEELLDAVRRVCRRG
jgi:phosphoglycolate phosphatase